MKISQQTWNDLLMTPSIQSVTQKKYTDNGMCVYIKGDCVFVCISVI
jgi:hypothetical protein